MVIYFSGNWHRLCFNTRRITGDEAGWPDSDTNPVSNMQNGEDLCVKARAVWVFGQVARVGCIRRRWLWW